VRELENVIERALILSDDSEVDLAGLLPGNEGANQEEAAGATSVPATPAGQASVPNAVAGDSLDMKDAVKTLEISLITSALRETRGNQIRAAKSLGISREGLRKKMARYDMAGQNFSNPG
jgi:DNA-binding NtrC family response regulator